MKYKYIPIIFLFIALITTGIYANEQRVEETHKILHPDKDLSQDVSSKHSYGYFEAGSLTGIAGSIGGGFRTHRLSEKSHYGFDIGIRAYLTYPYRYMSKKGYSLIPFPYINASFLKYFSPKIDSAYAGVGIGFLYFIPNLYVILGKENLKRSPVKFYQAKHGRS